MKYTEEEKKAIKDFKEDTRNAKIYKFQKRCEVNIKILDLLEKQQKEIEEKDKLICFNRKYINELEQDLFENASNYVISKEAIREKIKELKDNRSYLSKFDDWKEKEYTNEDNNNMCVEVLEDLLGDE